MEPPTAQKTPQASSRTSSRKSSQAPLEVAEEPLPPGARRQYCGLGNHHVRAPFKMITNQHLLRFGRRLNPELRASTPVCGVCADFLQKIFAVKQQHRLQQQKAKARATAQTNSISDVSSSQTPSQSQSAGILLEQPTTSSNNSSLTTIDEVTSTSMSSSKRKRTESQSNGSAQPPADGDDDNDSMLSLNAVNGTRLPNIQPIPKRRPTVHLNKPAMDIYLAGTTGG